jgi:hypothetical protein
MVRAKVYRKSYTEQDVQNALDYLRAGHTKNVSLAADTFGVKCGTLHNWNQEELPLMHIPEVRWLTGAKGREHWRVEEVTIQAKKQKKADVVARKEQAEAEKQQ